MPEERARAAEPPWRLAPQVDTSPRSLAEECGKQDGGFVALAAERLEPWPMRWQAAARLSPLGGGAGGGPSWDVGGLQVGACSSASTGVVSRSTSGGVSGSGASSGS